MKKYDGSFLFVMYGVLRVSHDYIATSKSVNGESKVEVSSIMMSDVLSCPPVVPVLLYARLCQVLS